MPIGREDMSEFNIKPDNVLGEAVEEKRIGDLLASIEGEINDIANNYCLQTSSMDNIRRRIKQQLSELTDEREKVLALASALESIVAEYKRAENLSAHKSIDDAKFNEATSSTYEKIVEAGNRCGMNMDTSAFSADPVNLCTGNYVYEKVLMEYDSLMDMKFRTFYNIQTEQSGSIGKGWTHTYEESLTIAGDRIDYRKSDGELVQMFSDNDRNVYVAISGEELQKTEDGYLLTINTTTKLNFSNDGLPIRKESVGGAFIDYAYDDDKKLISVTDENKYGYHFEYDDYGHISQVTEHTGRTVSIIYEEKLPSTVIDAMGYKTSYKYNNKGQLEQVVNAKGIVCLTNEFDNLGRTVRQEFPDGGQMKFDYDDENKQVILTEQNGNKIIYKHDEKYRNVCNIYVDGEESYTYDDNNHKTSYTDKRGNKYLYSYDKKGNLLNFTNPLGTVAQIEYNNVNQPTKVLLDGKVVQSVEYNEKMLQLRNKDAVGNISEFVYDDNNNLIKMIRPDGSEVEMKYNQRGNLSEITNSMGGVTKYEYNSRNQVIKTIDPLGNSTEFFYDKADRIIKTIDASGQERSYTYDECGNLIGVCDYNGSRITIEYNKMNKPVSVTDANGNVSGIEYDNMWNPVSRTDACGNRTQYIYNQMHMLIEQINPDGGRTALEYDPNGNLVKRTDPEGGVHIIEYDAINRPIAVIDPCGVRTESTYDANGNVTSIIHSDGTEELYEYDSVNNPIAYVDRNGYRQEYQYDALGNMTCVSDEMGILEEYTYYPGGMLKSAQYADGSCELYEYDANENLVKMSDKSGSVWRSEYDCLGRITGVYQEGGRSERYEYDALGNMTALIDGMGNRMEYQYSPNGELIAVIDKNGNITNYEYDKNNLLIEIIQPGNRVTKYTRDKMGNIVSIVENGDFKTDYSYDLCGRIVSKTENDGTVTTNKYYSDGNVSEALLADGNIIKYRYNALKQLTEIEDCLGITRLKNDGVGRVNEIEKPDGSTVCYEWGLRGEKKAVVYPDGTRTNYEYNQNGHLLSTTMKDTVCKYSYLQNGRMASRSFSNGIGIDYAYNKAGNISAINYSNTDGQKTSVEYIYDTMGRKSSKRITDALGVSTIFNYRYDNNGSLLSVDDGVNNIETYEYDIYGNRVSSVINGERCDYFYNSHNQLINKKDSANDYTYSYDERGNLKSIFNGKIEKTLKFNAAGLIERVDIGNNRAIEYRYDAFGCRTDRSVYETCADTRMNLLETEQYVGDITIDSFPLLYSTNAGKKTIHMWDSSYIGCMSDNEFTTYMCDELMTPKFLYKAGQITRVNSDLSSFGASISGRDELLYGFAGYRPDSDTGFMHVNAREYDPANGRFISRDALMGMINLPLTYNLYNYCLGDPVNNYDPTGEILAHLAAGIVGAVVNVTTKAAGDVVKSVKAGKPQFSSWQSYVGTAAGGFTSGVVLATTGNVALAGAAGGAVENLTTGGLSMLTGAEGYRKEDGYSWKNLVGSTVEGAATGAAAGFVFGAATKYIKIPGITAGRGSYEAVWKQVMTKTARGQIANVTGKTLLKGIVAYGVVGLPDKILKKGISEIKDWAKNKGKDIAISAINKYVPDKYNPLKIFGGNGSAKCPAESA